MPIPLYPFPRPRITTKRPSAARLAAMTPRRRDAAIRRSADFSTRVQAWQGRIGLRAIGYAMRERGRAPSAARLADWIEDRTRERGAEFIADCRSGEKVGPYRIAADSIERRARAAAEFALDAFDFEAFARRSAGGRNSRRGPTYTPDLLRGLEGRSIADQARVLGCSEATISRLRRALAEGAHFEK